VFENDNPIAETVFAEGWLRADGEVLGRPVDILELEDGSLLVSDDKRGVIYRIAYIGAE
jgi:glucose/arabinose dehydrogenase